MDVFTACFGKTSPNPDRQRDSKVSILQRLKPGDGFFAGLFQVHNGSGIAFWDNTTPGWVVNPLVVELCQLRHPVPNKLPLRIKALTLGHRIEHTKVGRSIGTR